ncbi:restriction endonuclease [Allonocardiopsis opalescens]|uniref:restriction endonuclease n=1 Tax=Allonocardiopsis opalescens TaxID=1144618 RepID=UPI001FEC15F6|nr:restriction endonuclease [Allonocardiopsis opalescens]
MRAALAALALLAAVGLVVWVAGNWAQVWPWLAGGAGVALPLAAALLVLWRREQANRRRWWLRANANLGRIDAMPGIAFEVYVAELLRRDGYTRVVVHGGANDGGVDITCRSPDGRPVAVQCKRWRSPVPAHEIRDLLGALASTHRGHVGVFVTSSRFTGPAVQAAHGSPVVLVDRASLARWIDRSPPALPAR